MWLQDTATTGICPNSANQVAATGTVSQLSHMILCFMIMSLSSGIASANYNN